MKQCTKWVAEPRIILSRLKALPPPQSGLSPAWSPSSRNALVIGGRHGLGQSQSNLGPQESWGNTSPWGVNSHLPELNAGLIWDRFGELQRQSCSITLQVVTPGASPPHKYGRARQFHTPEDGGPWAQLAQFPHLCSDGVVNAAPEEAHEILSQRFLIRMC